MLPFYRRPITLKTVLWILLPPIALVSIFAILWLAWGARPLNLASEFNLQTPALPSPNAHDLYHKAAVTIEVQMDPRKPVALVLDYNSRQSDPEDPKKYPLEGKRRWLEKNRPGFQLFDQALQVEYYFPPVRSAQRYGTINAPYQHYNLGKYIAVECEVLAADGKSEQAINRAIDIWHMGLHVAHGAPLPVALSATKLEYLAKRKLNGEIAHLNGAEAGRIAKRLETLLATRVPHRATLQEDRAASLFQIKPHLEASIHEKAQAAEFEAALERGQTSFYSDGEPAPELGGPVVNWTVRRLAQEYAGVTELLLANADAPWSRRHTTLPANLRPEVAQMLATLEKSHFFMARPRTMGNIVLARLALHAYRKDRGVYPQSLKELVPTYLAKAPEDPFADNRSLRYELSGKRYKLWSLGPDARDDNARPIVNTTTRIPSQRYVPIIDSTGDIVAQVND